MKQVKLGNITVPQVAVGCMRISNMEESKLQQFVAQAVDMGLNFFDHADIYGNGECETAFAKAIKATHIQRSRVILQSKCGIVPNVMYDWSTQHIVNSVDGILKRLNTDYLDILLLHRPDVLFRPEEVAQAFDILYTSGKVRQFGVSNLRPYQIELIQKYTPHKLVANQLQLSPTHANMISQALEVNMTTQGALDREGGIMEYCRLNDITIQAWSPFQYGFFEGVYLDNDKFAEVNNVLSKLANKYNTDKTAIVTAWFCTHPANMQVVSGTTNIDRLSQMAKGADITLTRQEWYSIYLSAGHILP